MFKKLMAVTCGLLLLAGVATAAKLGDTTVSYKGNSAYFAGAVYNADGTLAEEDWVLRVGDKEGWNAIEYGYKVGVFMVLVEFDHPEYGSFSRVIYRVGFRYIDTGWQERTTEIKHGATVSVQYFKPVLKDDILGFDRESEYILYDNKEWTRESVESMIYGFAMDEYVEGQEGR